MKIVGLRTIAWPSSSDAAACRRPKRGLIPVAERLDARLLMASGAELQSAAASAAGLAAVMDREHVRYGVYEDVSSPGNHFHAWGKIGQMADFDAVRISGAETNNPHSGATAIRGEVLNKTGNNFGGFYFLNGTLSGDQRSPQLNFGETPNAGVNLQGATELTFWARGERGGELVDFFVSGVGYDAVSGQILPGVVRPDSSKVIKISARLNTSWTRYVIPLQGRDLSYVLGGFGWSASVANFGGQDVRFYMDDIQYELNPTRQNQRLNEPRFLRSFVTLPVQTDTTDSNRADDLDFVLRNTAFTYDNALALLAFLADAAANSNPDSLRRARLIGDAFVYAERHDRTFNDGRLRSAYAAGDISLPPGWNPKGIPNTVPVPGFYVEDSNGSGAGEFFEVEQGNIDVGNNAWALIALMGLYQATGGQDYLITAQRIGGFLRRFHDTTGEFQGFLGGIKNPESNPEYRLYASTEHNLDLYSAFTSLAAVTGDSSWTLYATHARTFVESMWDDVRRTYLTGTTPSDQRNPSPIPLDPQSWRLLAMPDFDGRKAGAIFSAERNHRTTSDGFTGFDFNEDKDGVWFEGTGQMAVAYAFAGNPEEAKFYRNELRRAQSISPFGDSRLLAAASHDGLTTGFDLEQSGDPFLYFRRLHIGATSWNIYGQLGFNPYTQIFVTPPPTPPLPPPESRLEHTQLLIRRGTIREIMLSFGNESDHGLVSNLNNYRLITSGRNRQFGDRDDVNIPLRSIIYDRNTRTVRLFPRRGLTLFTPRRLALNGVPVALIRGGTISIL